MCEWNENDNGNYVYVIDSDDVMTVYERNGEWFGVYDNHFTDEGYKTAEQAMNIMEKAVLEDQLDILVESNPRPTGWLKTKSGGFHRYRNGGTMTVKKAKSGAWYLVVNQTMLKDKWFKTAEEAMMQGDQL